MKSSSQAWYKNPYVWLVIALPMSAVIGGIATVIITSNNQPDMVVDDYYKKGKAINQELALYKAAASQGVELSVEISDDIIMVENNGNYPALKVSLIHSTIKNNDLSIVLTPNAKSQLTGVLEQPLSGKWQIIIEPMDGSWKVRSDIALPTEGRFQLK